MNAWRFLCSDSNTSWLQDDTNWMLTRAASDHTSRSMSAAVRALSRPTEPWHSKNPFSTPLPCLEVHWKGLFALSQLPGAGAQAEKAASCIKLAHAHIRTAQYGSGLWPSGCVVRTTATQQRQKVAGACSNKNGGQYAHRAASRCLEEERGAAPSTPGQELWPSKHLSSEHAGEQPNLL